MTVTTRDSEISIVAHACTMFLLSPGVLLVGAVGLLEAGILLGEDLHLHDHLVVELNHCLVQPGHSDDDNDNLDTVIMILIMIVIILIWTQ